MVKRIRKNNPDKSITTTCKGCGIQITRYKSLCEQSKSGIFYHDKECYVKSTIETRKQNRNSKKRITVDCTGCKIPITKLRNIYNKSKTKRFYHDQECYFNSKYSRYDRNVHITVNCNGCGIPIDKYKSTYERSNNKKFYHNRKCFFENSDTKNGSKFKYIYLECYRCGTCGNYFKKSEARMYTTKTGNHTYPVCPDLNCGNHPIQTVPRNKKRYRVLVKEQEQKEITIPVLQSLQ